jgi:predicted Zn-dependent protease
MLRRVAVLFVLCLLLASRGSAQASRIAAALDGERWADALALIDSALAATPRVAALHAQRGRTLRELDRLPDAQAAYDNAIAFDSTFGAAWAGRATVRIRLGQPRAALEDLARARQLGFVPPQLDLLEGMALVDATRVVDAVRPLERYTRAVRGDPAGWYFLGVALGSAGRHADAAVAFTASIEAGLPGPRAYAGRALARVNAGDEAGACADARIAVERGDARLAPIVTRNCR